MPKTVALITMGCARNDVDSEELAGRLAADGWKLVDDAAQAEVAVINTCGFIESAKQDSINTLLEAHALKENGVTKAVVAVGCMAERYGEWLEGKAEQSSYATEEPYFKKQLSGRLLGYGGFTSKARQI